MARRLSLCFAAPGHALLPTAGDTCYMMSLGAALSEFADVTLAFRWTPSRALEGYRLIAIEPDMPVHEGAVDDVAVRGLNPWPHLAYMRRLHAFAKERAPALDVILEKGWRLSGALLAAFRRHGVGGVLVENDVRAWSESVRKPRTLLRYGLHRAAEQFTRVQCRQVPIIAETEALKAMLVRVRGVDPEHVEVVGLGVDHRLFRPLDHEWARSAVGIEPAVPVLLYVGGLDAYHDLGPVIEALPKVAEPMELHVVGDGVCRAEYQDRAARSGALVRFHGAVPHERVPVYIAAADACLAPYRESAFYDRTVPFSTLKISEYMACGRPVISVPSGHIGRLVEHAISGFLIPNEVDAWSSLLAQLPQRERLTEMGQAAAKAVQSLSWEHTAARYLAICERLVAGKGRKVLKDGTRS